MSSVLRSVSLRSRKAPSVTLQPIATHIFSLGPNEMQLLHTKFAYLSELGGAAGIANALRSDVKNGLHQDELDEDQCARRESIFGNNAFEEAKKESYFQLCLDILSDPMLILLLVAGVISIGLGLADSLGQGWYEGASIIFAVALVTIVGATNEWNQQKQLASLDRSEEADKVIIIRGGKSTAFHPNKVQVGDIVLLSAGGFIPADGIIVADDSIKVNESKMTGESKDIAKHYYEPFLFGGTEVREGQATMLVTAVGSKSAYGRIMSALAAEPEQTPLQLKLEEVATFIGYMGAAVALVLFIVLFGRWLHTEAIGHSVGKAELNDLLSIFIVSVTIIVVAVPEGLPLAVVVSLAYSMKKMYLDNIVVHKLSACEIMGNATTICSDKTGTLTQNLMTVNSVFLGGKLYNNALPSISDITGPMKKFLIESIIINSKAWVHEEECNSNVAPETWPWKEGNQTEVSLMAWMSRYNIDFSLERLKYPVEKNFPFDSIKKQSSVILSLDFMSLQTETIDTENKMSDPVNDLIAQATTPKNLKNGDIPFLQLQKAQERSILATRMEEHLNTHREHRCDNQMGYRRYYKGAAEVIVEQCSSMLEQDGQVKEMTPLEKSALVSTMDAFTKQGLRTIAFSFVNYSQLDRNDEGVLIEPSESGKDAVFVGLVGIKDPLRPEAYAAVRSCQRAGVIVRMVTGDHIETAKFIARECGILTSDNHVALQGDEFQALLNAGAEDQLRNLIPRLRVMARSKPEDKEALVNWLKRNNEVVAVTGDGTNDAPALKAANVGLAMFRAGTAVSKAAAQIWILDDNFSSIVASIMWGRAVYDNIRKFVQFQTTVNIVALSLAVVGAVTGYGEPLTAVQLLWVNLIMDTFAALALGTEAPQASLLDRKPFKPSTFIISPVMWRNIFCQSCYQLTVLLGLLYASSFVPSVNAMPQVEHYTLIFNTFVFMQLFNEFNSRKVNKEWNVFSRLFDNWLFLAVVIGTVGVQILMVEVFGAFATTVGLSWQEWLVSIAFGAGTLPVGLLQRLVPVDYNFGQINLPDDAFEGAHLSNEMYDKHRQALDYVHANVNFLTDARLQQKQNDDLSGKVGKNESMLNIKIVSNVAM